ncbi:MAG: hypothetical protein HY842_11665, partial [Bacteroidetes bacterium]|nr:hypothetical protein [Bacteroidota bacterium]
MERTNSGNMAQPFLFEQPVKPTSQLKQKITLSNPGFEFNVFSSVHNLPMDWEKSAPPDNLFLHIPYLTCVEENPPVGMYFSYLIFYKNDLPAGIAYCQVSPFSVGESIQTTEEKDKYPCIFRAFGQYLKNLVVGKNRNLLVDSEEVIFANVSEGTISVATRELTGETNYRTLEDL